MSVDLQNNAMRNKHLGDSLDLAKRRLLKLTGSLNMGTLIAPLPCQRDFQFDVYERVLGVEAPHVVHGRNTVRFSGKNRVQHLSDLDAAVQGGSYKALLLDPDSGLCEDHQGESRYLSPAEVRRLVDGGSLTWLLYHHQSAGRLSYYDVIGLLGAAGAYDFGKAAVVVGGQGEQTARLIDVIAQSLTPKRWISPMGGAAANPGREADGCRD